MTHLLRNLVLGAALVAGTAGAQAQTVITREPSDTVVTRERVFTPPQRTVIYRRIIEERVVEPAGRERVVRERDRVVPAPGVRDRTTRTVTVGTRVPQTTTLYTMPQTIVSEVPTTRRHSYAYDDDDDQRVLVVDPRTRVVVDEIEE